MRRLLQLHVPDFVIITLRSATSRHCFAEMFFGSYRAYIYIIYISGFDFFQYLTMNLLGSPKVTLVLTSTSPHPDMPCQ